MRFLAGVALVFCVAASAESQQQAGSVDANGWRAARWGMTEQQVLAASNGEARRLDKSEDYDFRARGEGKYRGTVGIDAFDLLGTPAKVRFLFTADSGRLAYVILHIEGQKNPGIGESNFAQLEKALTEKYGARTFGNAKRERGALGQSIKLQASWALKTSVIDLNYNYLEDIVDLVTLSYRPTNKKALEKI